MEKSQIKGRVTASKLKNWLENEFKRLEFGYYEVVEIYRTRFASHYYEAGACKLVIRFRHVEWETTFDTAAFLCDYSMKDLTEYIQGGYEMYLKFRSGKGVQSMTNLEIEVRKIK